jgi:hypothetical protein
LLVIILTVSKAPGQTDTTYGEDHVLNLIKIEIESEPARKLLKTDSLLVRKHNTMFFPEGDIPILELEPVQDSQCRNLLLDMFQNYTNTPAASNQIKQGRSLYTAKSEEYVGWISRASGSFKLSRIKNTEVKPTNIKHFKEAVQIAIDYIGKTELIKPVKDETIDVTSVSSLRNAYFAVDQKKSQMDFTSDYYVCFGRRFNDIPILGSRIMLRIDANRTVSMIHKKWRTIKAVSSETVSIKNRDLRELIVNDTTVQNAHTKKPLTVDDIVLVGFKCGYVESFVNYVQTKFRPGCIVSFFVKCKSKDIMTSQLIYPLEDNVPLHTLLGEKL